MASLAPPAGRSRPRSGRRGGAGPRAVATLILGEVHTGLLQHAGAVGAAVSADILRLAPGGRVRTSERPIAYAESPEILTGIDCSLAGASGGQVRGIGTVTSRAALTGGHLLQGSSYAVLGPSRNGRRMSWAHYLSHPGRVELMGKVGADDLAAGFLADGRDPAHLDLGAVSAGLMDAVQSRPEVDRRPPFRMARTEFRWSAVPGAGRTVRFTVVNSTLRTAHLEVPEDELPYVAHFCADLARHDWLLTSLLRLLERSGIGVNARRRVVHRLRPAVDHLLHLWMPAARMPEPLLPLWRELEHRSGLSRQWQTCVDRVRDQMDAGAIPSLDSPDDDPGPVRR
ncbi:SCO2521 family protein [Phytohabitans rumicis]|uniref:Uncharacterized protein n=1 Tax=Phytohabitans rumicis TaxID=1076125 RepID=A0A6V8LFU9_9ACTN|nr:SCO2521 family protein [Phytohabitans rumicis]GFJ92956.1 hypothetical protein Prum_065980 [Phytohabitans rumicis]